MNEPLGWGIVGPGQIARVFADSITESGVGRVVGVAGRDWERTKAFADAYGARTHVLLEALFEERDVEAVYIATPHALHAEAIRAATSGRHGVLDDGTVVKLGGVPVLCEKPLTADASATELSVWEAKRSNTPLIEGWMYRAHPQIARAVERIRAGEIGRVLRVESCFGFEAAYDPRHRLFAPELGGGAILDVGGYPLSLALLVAEGTAIDGAGWTIERPRAAGELAAALFDEVRCEWAHEGGEPRKATNRVDIEAFARLRVGGVEVVAEVSMARDLGRSGRFVGEDGTLELTDPFLPGGHRRGKVGEIVLVDPSGRRRVERVPSEYDCFTLEALAMRGMIAEGGTEPRWPMVDHAETVRIARLLQAWRTAIGAFE